MKLSRTITAVTATALLAFAAFAGSAQACSYPGATQVFRPWADQNSYVLAPDGGFEAGGAGWTLSDGAKAVTGNESYNLGGAGNSKSLSLPAGSSAGSPPVCMAIDTPSYRLFARNTGDPSSKLRVEAVYQLLGLVQTKVGATISAGPIWAPTQSVSTVLGLSTILGTLLPSSVQIRLTPADNKGQWQVDDLYVDPFARH